MTFLQKFTSILRSEENKDDKGSGRKIPSGFEKILKRTKRGVAHKKEEKEAAQSEKKEEEKKEEEEEAAGQSDQEEEPKKRSK